MLMSMAAVVALSGAANGLELQINDIVAARGGGDKVNPWETSGAGGSTLLEVIHPDGTYETITDLSKFKPYWGENGTNEITEEGIVALVVVNDPSDWRLIPGTTKPSGTYGSIGPQDHPMIYFQWGHWDHQSGFLYDPVTDTIVGSRNEERIGAICEIQNNPNFIGGIAKSNAGVPSASNISEYTVTKTWERQTLGNHMDPYVWLQRAGTETEDGKVLFMQVNGYMIEFDPDTHVPGGHHPDGTAYADAYYEDGVTRVSFDSSSSGVATLADGSYVEGGDGILYRRDKSDGTQTEYMTGLGEGLGAFTALDRVEVPEPATIGLLAVGALALVRRRRA